jgi:hypothetical protein
MDEAGMTVMDIPFMHEDAVRMRAASRMEMDAAAGRPSDPAPAVVEQDVITHQLVRLADGTPVACGALVPAPDGVVEIRGLYVRREVRDARQAGNLLLDSLEAAAVRDGSPAVLWECPDHMDVPIAAMTARGYRRIANWGPYVANFRSACFAKVV